MTYSTMALNRQRYAGRNQNTINYKSEKRGMGPVSNTIILVVLACLLGLLYLTQVTKTNAFGYKINSLRQQQTELRQEHDELEVAAARLQAVDRVKNSEVAKGLVTVAPNGSVQN